MRILVVGINYAPDLIGVAKYNTELCEALAAAGHEVRIVTAPPYYPEWRTPDAFRGWRYRRETAKGVAITRTPIYVPGNPTGAKRLIHHATFALTSAWPIISNAVRWRPDVVFSVAPSLMSAALSAWMARRVGAFSWLHLQDFEIDAAFDLGLLKNKRLRAPMIYFERKIIQAFDRVSSISPQMLDRLVAKGIHRARTHQMRNWVDTARIFPGERQTRFRRELKLDESHFVGLYSGTMSNKQGLELVIEAARELGRTDSRARFVLCGDGPHRAKLQELSAGLANVQFLPLQPDKDLAELLNSADVHLIPQKAEATDLVLPSKLGGIFASARPSIVMARPDSGLAIEVGSGGLIIPPGDAIALANAIRSLATDRMLCRKLGNSAREIALTRWDKGTILSTLEKILASPDQQEGAQAFPRLPKIRGAQRAAP